MNKVIESLGKQNEHTVRLFFGSKAKEGKELNNIMKTVKDHYAVLHFERAGHPISMHHFMHQCLFCISHVRSAH